MLWGFKHQIWLYQQPIDFRKQIDGLVMMVADVLKHDPVSGQLFIFRNREADKLKLLLWDENGFWLLYKRLEKGRFRFPQIVGGSMELSRDELQALLLGLDFKKQHYLPKINAKNFY